MISRSRYVSWFKIKLYIYTIYIYIYIDRLCGLVVRVLDYRHRGPGFDSRALQKKISGSGTGCTQTREYKLRSYLIEK
jgi:hypothetical protein